MQVNRNRTREKIYQVIFETDTPDGKLFDIILLFIILASVIVVMLESVSNLQVRYGTFFYVVEWIFTIFFTIEYILRLYSIYRPKKYATSFFGVIDLLAILPTYIDLFIPGTHTLLVIRALRLLRIFRIFKLASFIKESYVILDALRASRYKITVFISFIMILVTLLGSVMYLVEGGQDSGFTSIPRSIYWAIVTLTTVGYGDISPVTEVGQVIAAAIMILGYSVIAVPTGIVSAEMVARSGVSSTTRCCHYCGEEGHDDDAKFCKFCGEELDEFHYFDKK